MIAAVVKYLGFVIIRVVLLQEPIVDLGILPVSILRVVSQSVHGIEAELVQGYVEVLYVAEGLGL